MRVYNNMYFKVQNFRYLKASLWEKCEFVNTGLQLQNCLAISKSRNRLLTTENKLIISRGEVSGGCVDEISDGD